MFSEQIEKLNSQGLERLNNIFAMDGDGATVSKEELMSIYSLMDLDIGNKDVNGELNVEQSVLNNANDEEYKQIKDSVVNTYKKEDEVKNNVMTQNDIVGDSAKVIKFAINKPEFDPEQYSLDALKKRFPEPEYTVKEEPNPLRGLPPIISVHKNGQNIAMFGNDGEDVNMSLYDYDEHGNITQKVFATDGVISHFEEHKRTYDERGNMTSHMIYRDGELVGGSYDEYNEHNQVIKTTFVDKNGKPKRIEERTYDEGFKLYYVKDKNGELIAVYDYQVCDTQEDLDYNSKYNDYQDYYLRTDVVEEEYVANVNTETIRDGDGNIIAIGDAYDKTSPIADDIYAAISAKNSYGLPTTDLIKLKTAVDKLNGSNITDVIGCYKDTYGTDILADIKQEYGARLTNKDEFNVILDKLKTVIVNSAHIDYLNKYLIDELSGMPDTEFVEGLIMSDNFLPVIADENFKRHNGKSLIQNIMDKNLTMDIKTREKLIRYVIDKRIGTPEDYSGKVKFDMEGTRKAAYAELDYQLNKFGTMDAAKLDGILDNMGFNTAYKDPNVLNGKVDQVFSQGENDCWLISAIQAISLTKNADKYFSDILTLTETGSVQVKLKGEKPYTVTNKDIETFGFFLHSGSYGDGDVRAIELAFEHKLIALGHDKRNALESNTSEFAFKMLVGEDKVKYYDTSDLTESNIKSMKNLFNDENNAIVAARFEGGQHTIDKAYKSDGSEVRLLGKHGYTVSRTDNKYVYFIDPNVGKEEYHIAIKDFKYAFDGCTVATLE